MEHYRAELPVTVKIWLSGADLDRLMAIREQQCRMDWTIDEIATELLEHEIYRLHPDKVIDPDDFT